jgi:hypothetical protein
MREPPLRRRVVISNTHDVMIVGIFNAWIHRAQLVEFASAKNSAQYAEANNYNDNAWENVFHSKS